MVKSIKHMEKALRTFVRRKLAPKERVKYQPYPSDAANVGPTAEASGQVSAENAAREVTELRNRNALAEPNDGEKRQGADTIYIQVGAGAGDQDSRADFRDGFTEYVKKMPREAVGRILLVEPNPMNIPALKVCWKDYPQAEIYQYGIVPKRYSGTALNFYYLPSDAPHYQVASVNAHHVLKHYRKAVMADLKVMPIETIDLERFLQLAVAGHRVELLCLDIEGIDADVILDTDLKRLNVQSVSFEHLHLGDNRRRVVSHFEESGYEKAGAGIDYNDFDWLYKKRTP